MLNLTDYIGVHRPSLNKDFKHMVSDLVAFLNGGALNHTTLLNNNNGTYTFTSYNGAVTFTIDTNVSAADVPITDTAGNFTATNVEAALQEIATELNTLQANKVAVLDNAGNTLGYLIGP